MNISVNTGLSGRFRLVKSRNGEVSQELEFDNLILDSGLEQLGVGAIVDRCKVGSGSTAPTVYDVNLAAELATSTDRRAVTPYITANTASRWTEIKTCYRFAAGVGTGTIAEVGMGWASGLWSRALIKDGSGVPTTITKLADETLDVYYTLRIQLPASDITGSIVLEGVTYSYVLRPAMINTHPQTQTAFFGNAFGSYNVTDGSSWYQSGSGIAAVDSAPGGNAEGNGRTSAAYTPGSKTRRITYSAGLDAANVSGGFKSIVLPVSGAYSNAQQAWQMGFYISGVPAAVPKTATKIFSIVIDYSWSRGS